MASPTDLSSPFDVTVRSENSNSCISSPGLATEIAFCPTRTAHLVRPIARPESTLVGEAGAREYVPHVVAWNLTRRCNLECAHCYISAGPSESADGELTTDECLRIAEEILELNPSPMFILSGGEPLLRDDLTTIAAFASKRGATVVVGTNGTLLTNDRIAALKDAGVSGVAVSVDSLDQRYHDNFRHGRGSLEATTQALARLREHRMDFIIQTTATKGNRSELARLVAWAAEQGAVSFNLYFLVATGTAFRNSVSGSRARTDARVA